VNFDQFKLDSRPLPRINRVRYQAALPIQAAAIPAALKGHDLIGCAQTGTGKTAAFVPPRCKKTDWAAHWPKPSERFTSIPPASATCPQTLSKHPALARDVMRLVCAVE